MAQEKKKNIDKELNKDEEKQLNINEIFEKLDNIVKEMEDPQLSLEVSFEKYTEGLKLLKECNKSIDRIEKQIEILEAQE